MSKDIKRAKKEKKTKPVLTEEELKKRKTRKTKAAVSCFILLLGIGVAGNWYWENSDLSSKISTVSTDNEKILGEATYVDATTEAPTENQYFADARVERQSARDESLEKLQKIIDSSSESDSAHKEAAEKIASISEMITTENKIETLVKAKGIDNCIAVINEDGTKVDVIVDCDELTDTIILKIKEIATAQLGCTYENVTIIQSN